MDRVETVLQALTLLDSQSLQCNLEISHDCQAADLQVRQLKYLYIIDSTPELTFGRFAEILQITKPSVTEIVNKLIGLGCVAKEQSQDDRRVFYIVLTEKGKTIARLKKLAYKRLAEKIVTTLSDDETAAFVEMIHKISGPGT